MSLFTLSSYLTSTCNASASPPAAVISRATVVMVLSGEFGSGGKGVFLEGSLVDFAATTTFVIIRIHVLDKVGREGYG